MATRNQFDVFKYVYEEENARFSELATKAKVYLSVITFFLGVLFFKIDIIIASTEKSSYIATVFLISLAFYFGALLSTILSLRVLPYEGLFNPINTAENLKEDQLDKSAFLKDRIVDFAVATERNYKQNNKKAECLERAGIYLILGFGTSFVSLIMLII